MPPKSTPAPKSVKKTSTATAAKSNGAKPAIRKMGAAKKPPAKATATAPKAKDEAAASAAPAAPAASAPAEPQVMGATVILKDFAKFIFDEPENDLKKSGRWPVVSDEAERATTFLRYRNTNMLNVMNENDMELNRVRLALIGGIRYGKPVVFDMMTADAGVIYERLVETLEKIQPGLMQSIIDKSILKEEVYKNLIKEEDGDEYRLQNFNDSFMKNFDFVITTGRTDLPEEISKNFFIVTVK